MILPIRLYGDPILRSRARLVDRWDEIPQLAKDMLETMHDAQGVGLAAPQIGLPLRLFVFADFEDAAEGEESRLRAEYVVVNPKLEIIDQSIETGTEGCLSIPGIYEDLVPRARAVRLSFQNEYAKPQSLELTGYLARVAQHEFDHLEGRIFFDLLPPSALAAHRAELADMQKQARAFIKGLRTGQPKMSNNR